VSLLVASENSEQLQALCQLLAGYDLVPAGSIAEVEQLANDHDALSGLLCDYHFSIADGRVVAEALRKKFRKLQVGFIAERTDVETDGHTIFGPDTSPDELLAWVASIMGPPKPNAVPLQPQPVPPVEADPLRRPTTLLGLTLGDYDIREKRRDFETTESYLAWQQSMGRFVVLERLKAAHLDDAEAKRHFRALVRARAAVSHPNIASVYEAQETKTGDVYYTRERVQGETLESLAEKKMKVPQEPLLRLLQAIGTSMGSYAQLGMGREPAQRYHFYLGDDGLPRVGNLALPQPVAIDEAYEMAQVGSWIAAVSGPNPPHAELPSILKRLSPKFVNRFRSWAEVGEAAKHALASVAAKTQPNTKKLPWPILAGVGAVIVGGILWFLNGREKPTNNAPRPKETGIGIGGKAKVAGFEIDKYEVSIGQYAEFLKATEGSNEFNHKTQPSSKLDHRPQAWAEYFPQAEAGQMYLSIPISLNSPVFGVDWWDAYAYAKWKGRRLPTLPEWQLAAQGKDAYPYPWGTTEAPSNANTGEDYPKEETDVGGKTDGYAYWCDVNASKTDVTLSGVVGMAGNVSEWTDTWGQHPSLPDQKSPIIAGGSFFNKPTTLDKQATPAADGPATAQPYIGFRTAK
jgi:formylglycine-generating enzyme required for sulfatase activity